MSEKQFEFGEKVHWHKANGIFQRYDSEEQCALVLFKLYYGYVDIEKIKGGWLDGKEENKSSD